MEYKTSERKREYMKKYNKENKERVSKYQKEYYLKNKKKVLAQSSKWAKDNRERQNEHIRKWTSKNRDYCKISSKTRRYFPINKDTKCKYCKSKAEEHHHNTTPIQFDKFDYVCKSCHFQVHNRTKHNEAGI